MIFNNKDSDPNIIQNKASDPTQNVWVSASAGTGKTKILIDRLLRLLLEGVTIDKIICISYTKVAAQEMINRLMKILARWSILEDEELIPEIARLTQSEVTIPQLILAKTLFAQILDYPENIAIQTIHSFCQNILNQFPIEAGIVSDFSVIEGEYENQLKQQAIDHTLSLKLNESNHNKKISELLLNIVTNVSSSSFDKKINEILQHSHVITIIKEHYKSAIDLTNFKNELFKQLQANPNISAEAMLENYFSTQNFKEQEFKQIVELFDNSEAIKINRSKNISQLNDFLNYSPKERILNFKTWFGFFLTQSDTPAKTLISKDNLKKLSPIAHDFVSNTLINEQNNIDTFYNDYKNQLNAQINYDFFQLALEILNVYDELKHMAGFLDYNDLIVKTYQLLKKEAILPWIMYKMDQKIEHILVDEAQDTSPMQWEIIKAFVDEFFSGVSSNENNRTFFVVGDIKQSIYSFQGADPSFFDKIKHYFENKIKEADKSWQQLPMNISFRSSESVIASINHITANTFDTSKAPYKQEELEHIAFFNNNNPKNTSNTTSNIELWPLLCSLKDAESVQPNYIRYHYMASSIIKKIQQLKAEENIDYGDILILYKTRKNNSLLKYIIKLLKQNNIPVLGIDKITITEHIIVKDLIALTKFLLQTNDDFSLACVLKSPMFNLQDSDIFELCKNKNQSLFKNLNQEKYLSIYETLKSWLKLVDFISVYDLFFQIIYIEKHFTKFLNRIGNEAIDTIGEFMTLILKFKYNNYDNLQNFLSFISSTEHIITRDSNKKDMVNLMTIHASKGLESKIVFLLDDIKTANGNNNTIINNYNKEQPLLFINIAKEKKGQALDDFVKAQENRNKEELKRLLYVAITRARDNLYICSTSKDIITKDKLDKSDVNKNHIWYKIITEANSNGLINNEDDDNYSYNPDDFDEEGVYVYDDATYYKDSNEKKYKYNFNYNFEEFTSDIFDETIGFIKNSGYRISNKNQQTLFDFQSNALKNNNVNDKANENTATDNNITLPKWSISTAPAEPYPSKPLSPSKINFEEGNYHSPLQNLTKQNVTEGASILDKGIIIHNILEQISDITSNKENFIQQYLKGLSHKLNKKDKEEIYNSITNLINHKDFAFIFNHKNSFNEVSVSGKIIDETTNEIILLAARVDKIIKLENEIHIIDYKFTKQKSYIPKNYITQMHLYQQLLAKIYPKKIIRSFIIFTQDPSIVEIENYKNYTQNNDQKYKQNLLF